MPKQETLEARISSGKKNIKFIILVCSDHSVDSVRIDWSNQFTQSVYLMWIGGKLVQIVRKMLHGFSVISDRVYGIFNADYPAALTGFMVFLILIVRLRCLDIRLIHP